MNNTIEMNFPGGKKVDCRIGNFTIHTDQTENHGGEESAPTPFQLFMASLGTCAANFALEFCQIRGISTDGLSLFTHFSIDDKTKIISEVTIEVILPREFPEKYKNSIAKAIDLCVVKKNIVNSPEFKIITGKK